MTLYEINQEILKCVDDETGELLDFDKVNELYMQREVKIKNLALWIKDLRSEEEALKKEKQAFEERQKLCKKKIEKLEEYLQFALNGQKFHTTEVDISFRKNKVVEVDDWTKLEGEYLRYKEPEINKVAIKAAIKEGKEVVGARIVEKLSMSIK